MQILKGMDGLDTCKIESEERLAAHQYNDNDDDKVKSEEWQLKKVFLYSQNKNSYTKKNLTTYSIFI